MNETALLRCGLTAARALVAGEPFERLLADGLRRIVGTDCVSVNVWHTWRHQPAVLTLSGEPQALPSSEVAAWSAGFGSHPYFANLLATGDPRPYRTSDFMSFRRFRGTLVYCELLLQYELAMKGALRIAPFPSGLHDMYLARFVVPFRLMGW